MRRRPGPGTFLGVPVGERWAWCRVLSEKPFVAFYDVLSDEPDADPAWIADQPVAFVCAVAYSALKDDSWIVVGKVKASPGDVPIPRFFSQARSDPDRCHIAHPDGTRTLVRPEDCVGLDPDAVWARNHIEDRLADHFAGRPNGWMQAMALVLPD